MQWWSSDYWPLSFLLETTPWYVCSFHPKSPREGENAGIMRLFVIWKNWGKAAFLRPCGITPKKGTFGARQAWVRGQGPPRMSPGASSLSLSFYVWTVASQLLSAGTHPFPYARRKSPFDLFKIRVLDALIFMELCSNSNTCLEIVRNQVLCMYSFNPPNKRNRYREIQREEKGDR